MLKGFAIRIEDNSRGSFSDEAAHRFLAAIHEESCKMLAALERPDLLVKVLGDGAECLAGHGRGLLAGGCI